MAELALEAGFPDGAFNVVTGYGREAGAALAAHPRVDYVTFTGSPRDRHGDPAGGGRQQPRRHAWSSAASRRRSSLPTPTSTRRCRRSSTPIIQNGGQTCSAGSRVLVERPVYETRRGELAERFAALSPARTMPTSTSAR